MEQSKPFFNSFSRACGELWVRKSTASGQEQPNLGNAQLYANENRKNVRQHAAKRCEKQVVTNMPLVLEFLLDLVHKSYCLHSLQLSFVVFRLAVFAKGC